MVTLRAKIDPYFNPIAQALQMSQKMLESSVPIRADVEFARYN